jgi:hypothetical protein
VGRAAAIGVLLLLPWPATAQEIRRQPVQELFLTEVVYPQGKGEVQFTVGALVDRSQPTHAGLLPISIEYGLTNRWQIEAGWEGYGESPGSPFGEVRTARLSIGTKYSVMNIARTRLHAAAGINAEFPQAGAVGDAQGETRSELEPFVALAGDIRRVTLFGSLGVSVDAGAVKDLAERGIRPRDPGTASFGALIAFSHVTIATEYTDRSDSLPWRLDGAALITPSIVVHLGHEWELAAGTPIGMRRGEHTPGIALHAVKEF